MPRTARIAPIGYVYHVLTRGNNRQNIFKNEEDFQEYLAIMSKYKEKCKFKLYHYVLMTNHIHLVIEPIEVDLANIMKCINQSYARYYKNKYTHIGYFWENRYKSIIVSKDNYLLACGSYVELNPLRAKIAEDLKDYKWSSYNMYINDIKNNIIDISPAYKGLSDNENERKNKYKQFIKDMIIKRDSMKNEMNKRNIYANEIIIKNINNEYNIKEFIDYQGRPKKNEK